MVTHTPRKDTRITNAWREIVSAESLRATQRWCNKRAACGVDGQRLDDVDVKALAAELAAGTYAPRALRRRRIRKRSGGHRTIAVPCARDRIVAGSLGMFVRQAFATRRVQGVNMTWRRKACAIRVPLASRRCRWVVETDLAGCFDTIPHGRLLSVLRRRIADRRVLGLARQFFARGDCGIPQGWPCSPALCDVYLTHVLDRPWSVWARRARGWTWAARYVDDAVWAFEHYEDAAAWMETLARVAAESGLVLKASKTALRRVAGGAPVLFLGIARTRRAAWAPGLSKKARAARRDVVALAGLRGHYRTVLSRRSRGALRRVG